MIITTSFDRIGLAGNCKRRHVSVDMAKQLFYLILPGGLQCADLLLVWCVEEYYL